MRLGLTDGSANVAFDNARDVVDAERHLGLFFEPDLQELAIRHLHFVVDAANFMYVNSHFAITTIFLIWLYLMRNESYYFVRNMFIISMGIALVGYAVYPTAPPRFLGEWMSSSVSE